MKKILGQILFFFIIFNSTYALENKILFKIDNEIITSFDLFYEIEYLKLLNKNLNNLESVINMIENDVNHFIEIGPGKVLSGLVKRISKDVKTNTINSQSDIESLEI